MSHQILSKENKTHFDLISTFLSCMLVLPFASHWILPDGMEQRMYLRIAGIPFYVFNVCYLIYIIGYKTLLRRNEGAICGRRTKQIFLAYSLFFLLMGLFSSLIASINIRGTLALFFDNQSLVWASLIFLQFPMNEKMIDYTKYVIIPTALIICCEVVLYSLGIMQYSEELGNVDYGGVMRISTTIGEATGTATALTMMGGLVYTCYRMSKLIKYSLLLFIAISIFFTISRGSIAIMLIFFVYVLYKEYLRHSKFKTKIKTLMFALTLGLTLSALGVFDPLYNRISIENEDKKSNAERIEMMEKVTSIFVNSGGMGVGCGQTNIDKSLRDVIRPQHGVGVHNYYLCFLAEMGIVGAILLFSFILMFLRKFDFTQNISFFSILLLLISFNTEPIYVYAEFMYPAFFIFMASLKKTALLRYRLNH